MDVECGMWECESVDVESVDVECGMSFSLMVEECGMSFSLMVVTLRRARHSHFVESNA